MCTAFKVDARHVNHFCPRHFHERSVDVGPTTLDVPVTDTVSPALGSARAATQRRIDVTWQKGKHCNKNHINRYTRTLHTLLIYLYCTLNSILFNFLYIRVLI